MWESATVGFSGVRIDFRRSKPTEFCNGCWVRTICRFADPVNVCPLLTHVEFLIAGVQLHEAWKMCSEEGIFKGNAVSVKNVVGGLDVLKDVEFDVPASVLWKLL